MSKRSPIKHSSAGNRVFRTISRLLLPNRLDWICRRARRRREKRFLLAWNRGLGDIALGLYAIVHRIRHYIPDAEITFLIRNNLQEGFSLLQGVTAIIAPDWKRGEPYDVKEALQKLGKDPKKFDVIISWPNPTEWVNWQYGHLVPRLVWNSAHDALWKKFDLPDGFIYIGAQVNAETHYGLWRNWPEERWRELIEKIEKQEKARLILFGYGSTPRLDSRQVIDLRGRTSLFELLSIIKNRCRHLIVPDSGILSMAYYLDAAFPLQVLSLWADPKHGVLKQNVASPNPLLVHRPLIGEKRDLRTISADDVLQHLSLASHAK
jgi:ADP-heptose:LPS heptosyltransferase